MGVHGLTSYVEGNRGLFQDIRFRDSRLVIDGCSLFFRLYLNHGLDQVHGGDYDAFGTLLSTFISALEACNIQPYVVLDGGVCVCLCNRICGSRIDLVSNLRSPINKIHYKKLSTLRQRLQSKIREAESLSRGRHGSVLPLLTRHVFIQVLSQRGVPLVQCPAEADWEIACLANQWDCPVLTNDSDFYIFDLPGGYIPFGSSNGPVLRFPSKSLHPSQALHEPSLTWFSGGSSRSPEGACGLLLPCPLPEWLCWAAGSGRWPPWCWDVLELRRVLLIPQVENSRLPSSHCSATAIRQALYGILLANQEQGERREGERGWGEGNRVQGQGGQETQRCECVWREYDRHDLNLRKSQVEPRTPRTRLHLETLCQAPVSVRLEVLYDVLGVKESSLSPLPPHLRLALGVTGFWRREARPFPSLPQVQALLLGMVHGEMARNTHPGQNQNTAAERNLWMKLRLRPGDRRGFDVGVAHSLSQWQACLWSVLSLNQLLCLPLPEPDTAWLFSGSLVHGLVGRLRGGCSPESVLAAAPLSGHIYRSLLAALENCTLNTLPSSSGRRKRGNGRRGRGRGRGRGGGEGGAPSSQEINNRFALLMTEEDEE
ncbi:protein asteroid homolog 1-like [Coregonus clupeaformis]|uniref:protein asteroid homolog 1-like n=1 Tax=Coregonus clupeaformis TaxID=59861 RepID=UPI001E1C97F8|nr:protein asteroid homolog 1-like [Coregonus clupeaformis]